jgi:hypothetical protein
VANAEGAAVASLRRTKRHPRLAQRRREEERQVAPSTVPGTEYGTMHIRPDVLTFDFPGYGSQHLQHISWNEWFTSFDGRHLIFVYQGHLKSGKQSP